MNNSNNVLFNWKNRKVELSSSATKIKVLVLHHGSDGNDESSSFWKNIVNAGLDFSNKNDMTITFKGFDDKVDKMIEYLDKFNNEKTYKNYDAIVSTVLNSSTYGELNPDSNEELKDVTIASKLNIIGRAIPLFTFNTVSEKVDSAIKYIGNGKIGEEKMGKKLAIMAAKYAIDAVNMNNVLKFNSRTLQDEAFVAIVKDVTETIDLDGNGKLEREEIEAYLQPLGVNIDSTTLDLIIGAIETQFVNRGTRNIPQLNMTPAQIINAISKLSEQQQETIFTEMGITIGQFSLAQSFLPTIIDVNQQLLALQDFGITQETLSKVQKLLQQITQEPLTEEPLTEETSTEETEIEITEYEEENKITQLKSNTNFDINLLENMTKDNQIFNFFRNYANKLFDEIIIYASEENNSAFESRLNGIKRIFKEEKIKIFYKIDDIDNEFFDTEINYGIISLQEQNLDKMLDLIDDLKGKDINILSFGVCDLDEVIEKDVEYSFISAASGTKPNEQINNVLSSVKDFVSKLKKNNTSFVRNLHNKTSRAISETTSTGQSLYNIDTSNGQLISLDSIRESLNLNVINTATRELLISLNEQYPTNVELVNKLFLGIAFKNHSNNGQGYTVKIPNKYNCDIKNIINVIVERYTVAFNYIFSYKEDWNTDNDEYLTDILNKIYDGISFKDYFDIEFEIHNGEDLGFTHTVLDEQNIETSGIIDHSKIFSFYHLFNNTSGKNEQDKINKYLAIPLVKDVINYLNEICKGIAIVRLGVPLGPARKFDKDDRDALYYNRGTRKIKCGWCGSVKSAFNTAANETANVVKNADDYYNDAIKFLENTFDTFIDTLSKACPEGSNSNLFEKGKFFINILPKNVKYFVKEMASGSCFIFGASGEVTYTQYQQINARGYKKTSLQKQEEKNMEDLIKSGKIAKQEIVKEERWYGGGSNEWVDITYAKKHWLGSEQAFHKLMKNGVQIPSKQFWGHLKTFFNFGITEFNVKLTPVQYYIAVGGELSNQGGPTANTEIGVLFPEGGTIQIKYHYKFGTKSGSKNLRFISRAPMKAGYNSKGEFRVTITPKDISLRNTIKFSTTDIVNLLKLNDNEKKKIKNVLDQVNFGLEVKIGFQATLQPFIAMQMPTTADPKAHIFGGITIPNSKFGIEHINVIIPDWARKIPGFGSGYDDGYIIRCIMKEVQSMHNYTLPCFEVNTA